MKKQSRSSRNATHMNKRTKGRKGKSNKIMSLASRRSIIRETKQRRKIKINTDDIVVLGEEKVHDPRILFKRKPRIKRNAESEERNYETHASEDCFESIRQEDDSTNSSDTMNDNSSDDDFDIEKYNSSSNVDSFGTVARESTDEDCYTPDDFVVPKRRRKKTTDETANYHALKKNSSKKIDENEKSTKRPNDATCLISTEVSKNGSKDESSDRNELKKMETFVESSQQEKGLFIAQEASDEVSVAKVIFETDKDENLKICSNDVEESKCMEEEVSEKGSDLLKFIPIESLHIKEDHKGKRVNLSDHEEQEVTDMNRQKSSPTAPVTCARCTKIFQERDTISDTKVSEKKAPVGKDEANEPNHANKTTTKKPNEGVQIEEFTPKRQKLQSSASLDEGKNLSGKQSDEKEFSKEEENVGFTKKKKVYKKNDFFKVLTSRILGEEDVDEEGEDVIREETSQEHSQPSSPYSLPLKFRFEEKETEVQDKSEYEIMVAGLFTELETHWTYDNMNASTICKDQYKIAKVSRHESSEINSCGEGKHDLVRNQEIGDICRRCHQVVSEIRDILPDFAKNPTRYSKKQFVEKENFRVPEDLRSQQQ